MEIFTIGHSNRGLDEFLGLLLENGIESLADVRTLPKSKHVPHFNDEELAPALAGRDIEYAHFKALGGLRKAAADSKNLGWRKKGFRGYADYMATPEFERGLAGLVEAAGSKTLAYMCAEADPKRCHRLLLSDALTARGLKVRHILAPGESELHRLTFFARVRDGRVEYPEPEEGESPDQGEMW